MKALAFIDSGLGGLPYLEYTRQLLPKARYVYSADNLGFPYGTKSSEEIIHTFSSMVERVIRQHDPELFVVACNTASVVALSWLREHYPYEFVGVVPAVKPASEQSRARAIGVLATKRTVEGVYLKDLISRFAPDCTVVTRAATDLIAMIERDPFASDRRAFEDQLGLIRDEFLAAGVDTVVLGCTHFLLLKDLFYETMGSTMRVLDSRQGVAMQVLRLLDRHGIKDRQGSGPSNFWLTRPAPDSERYRSVAQSFALEYGGVLIE